MHEAASVAKSIPPVRVYKNVTLHGEAIIMCPNSTNSSTSGIKKTKFGPQVFLDIHTSSVLLTLQRNLDYESTQDYLLRITVRDAKGNQGNITVKVNVSYSSIYFYFFVCVCTSKDMCSILTIVAVIIIIIIAIISSG